MPDQPGPKDPGALWRNQPQEKLAVNVEQIVKRRTEELYSSTRAEILMSIAAALLFLGVIAWRLAPYHDRLQAVGFAAVLAWAGVSLYWFRHRIFGRRAPRPDAIAATGLEYYREEVEQRRDHMKNEWLWHGPLLLACLVLIGLMMGSASPGFDRLQNALPLILLLAVWTGFGFWRRRKQARELQREIDEIERLATGER